MRFATLSKFSCHGTERNCQEREQLEAPQQGGHYDVVVASSKTSSKSLPEHDPHRSNQCRPPHTSSSSSSLPSWNATSLTVSKSIKSSSVRIAPPIANVASQNGKVIMAGAAPPQAPAIPRTGVLILPDSSDDEDNHNNNHNNNDDDHVASPPRYSHRSSHNDRVRQSNPRFSFQYNNDKQNKKNKTGRNDPSTRTKTTTTTTPTYFLHTSSYDINNNNNNNNNTGHSHHHQHYHTKRTYHDEVDDYLDRKAIEKRKGTTIVPPYSTRQGRDHYRAPSSRNTIHPSFLTSISTPYNTPSSHHRHHHHDYYRPCSYERLGHASLQLYKVQLPTCLFPLLEEVVRASEEYARTLPHGWRTNLYSLTQQDVSLSNIPQLNVQPLLDYVRDCMQYLYPPATTEDDTRRHFHKKKRNIVMDVYQPHVLKYSVQDNHVGVELHHDKCDITCNLMLSSTLEYTGGGTWIPAMGGVIRLNFGEFLLHPGSLLHGGVDITSGCRYLMILFADFETM